MCGCGVVGSSLGSESGDLERLDLMGFLGKRGGPHAGAMIDLTSGGSGLDVIAPSWRQKIKDSGGWGSRSGEDLEVCTRSKYQTGGIWFSASHAEVNRYYPILLLPATVSPKTPLNAKSWCSKEAKPCSWDLFGLLIQPCGCASPGTSPQPSAPILEYPQTGFLTGFRVKGLGSSV